MRAVAAYIDLNPIRAGLADKPEDYPDIAPTGEALDWRMVGKIYDALDDLMLPYRFSLIHFNMNTDPRAYASRRN